MNNDKFNQDVTSLKLRVDKAKFTYIHSNYDTSKHSFDDWVALSDQLKELLRAKLKL